MCSTNQFLSLGLVPSEAAQGGRVGADVASVIKDIIQGSLVQSREKFETTKV